jgi:hypothetical protein
MISMVLLMVLVALAGVSPVFATRSLTFDPPAACPGERVTFVLPFRDIVGGGISIAAVSPLDNIVTFVLSSDPVGLIANAECSTETWACSFVVSGSATCGHYTVTVTLMDENPIDSVSGQFDVPSTCCPAVGGCVQPVNTFTLLSPWLAAIGLVGCIGTAVVVAKKR